jgi:hypothetical protein
MCPRNSQETSIGTHPRTKGERGMKRLSLKFIVILISIVLGYYLISFAFFVFLAPHQAQTAGISTFNTITWIMNYTPLVLGLAGICLLVSRILKDLENVLNLRKSWYEGSFLALKNKQLLIETIGQDQFKTVEEGNAVFLGPRYQPYQQVLIPRPRIERVTEVSAGQEQLLLQERIPEQFMLDGVTAIHDRDHLYFGKSASSDVLVPICDAYHILDIASSGKGKSNRFRLLMMQAVRKGCQTYFISPAANPVKPVKKNDPRKIEVWLPLFQRLAEQPKRSGEEIHDLLTRLNAQIEMRQQREQHRDFGWQDEPIYVFIDEMPEVVSRCPAAPALIDTIGRLGRQYCIFVCVATQDGLVQTIKQSTGAQANYKTRIYGGGDKISANRVMKSSVDDEKEVTLQSHGAGLTLMLADGLTAPTFVRAPLVTNEALFAYLDAGPFVLEEWLQERPSSISTQLSMPQEPRWTPSVEVERSPSYSLGFAGLPNISTASVEKVESQLKSSDQKQRVLTENEQFEAIDVIYQIEREGKRLTLNAIKTRTGLSWTVDNAIKELCTKLKKPLTR